MKKIKKKYSSPEADIEKFYTTCVITASSQDDYDDGDEF